MIKFSLKCSSEHAFESWFQSGAAYDSLHARGLVVCPACGATDVSKAMMAPALTKSGSTSVAPAPKNDLPARLAALKAEVEAHSDYVGPDFATQARAMYLGDIPDRPIHGEADPTEAKALIDDGVPILPLPFVPTRKTN